MDHPSSKVQQGLAKALFDLLRSPDLAPEDGEWLRDFATRTIAEFSIAKSKQADDSDDKPIAA